MNELLFNEGGQPIALDDLKQLNDNSVYLLQLIASLCGEDGILTGCHISGRQNPHAQVQISKGLVIIKGEIYEFDGAELDFPGQGLPDLKSFFLSPQEQTSRPMTFADGSSHPTRTRKIALASTERPEGVALEMFFSKMERPYIPREKEESTPYTTYTIIRGKKDQEIGYLNLYSIKGMQDFRVCELVIRESGEGSINADYGRAMYRFKGNTANHLNFSVSTSPSPSSPQPYQLFVTSGEIQLYKEGELQKTFSGSELSAIGLVKVS